MNTAFKQSLKAKAHHLKPVVLVGVKGFTPAVIEETHLALLSHELIKIKISGIEKENKQLMVTGFCSQLAACLIQLIGNVAIIYRKNEEKS